MSAVRPAYPGGTTTAFKRREAARRAGIASGVARRQRSTCRREPRPRNMQEALALRYRIRQVGPEEFERLYRAMCDREKIPFDARGLHTCLELYRQQMTAYRAQGQDWETTNSQMALGLVKRGRGRSRRTVQRHRKRLVAMGLLGYSHVKRSGALRLPGQMDTLRVRCLCPRANVTPPSGARASISPTGKCSARSGLNDTNDLQTLIAPPPAADEIRPFGADGSEDEQDGPEVANRYATEAARRLAFLTLAELHAPNLLSSHDRRELRQLRAATSGHGTARTASNDLRGLT